MESIQSNQIGDATYKVGSRVEVNGYYVCVPCGSKKYLKTGMKFPSCLQCLGKDKKLFRKGFELWEKLRKI